MNLMWANASGTIGYQFVEKAIANNCLIIPGSVFSERTTRFRICRTPDHKPEARTEPPCRLAIRVRA
jgi:hypothetical protein